MSRRSRLTAEERLKLRPQTHSASNLDHTRFKVREIGKFLPRDLQAKREATVEKLMREALGEDIYRQLLGKTG